MKIRGVEEMHNLTDKPHFRAIRKLNRGNVLEGLD